MSVAIIGRTPVANFMVTDAMAIAIDIEKVKSYRDCVLRDKIRKLYSSCVFYTLLGDEYLLWGIQYLDTWSHEMNVSIDFKKEETINQVLGITEKIALMHNFTAKEERPFQDTSTIYFIDKESVIEYVIIKNDNKYSLFTRTEFTDYEVHINYSGYKEKVQFEAPEAPIDKYFDESIRIINNFHQTRKVNPLLVGGKKLLLPYDFENRFCGALIMPNEEVRSITPFKAISELIASNYNNVWELIDTPNLFYNPF